MGIIGLLHDTHILIVNSDTLKRQVLIGLLRQMGATVHHAETQLQAVGMYLRLFRSRIRPRAVITDWWMSPPGTAENEFFRRYMPQEKMDQATTSLPLLRSVSDLDPEAFVAIYTDHPGAALAGLAHHRIKADVFDRTDLSPADFAARIACHKDIANQRAIPDELIEDLQTLACGMESGHLPCLRTPLPR